MKRKKWVVHNKKAPYDVYIGRPSIWGNPYTHLPVEGTQAQFQVDTIQEAVDAYDKWLDTQPDLLKKIPELKGKILGCWGCKPCHGDVLVRRANQPLSFPVTDDIEDAPDGAIVDGYERIGGMWYKIKDPS